MYIPSSKKVVRLCKILIKIECNDFQKNTSFVHKKQIKVRHFKKKMAHFEIVGRNMSQKMSEKSW